jgi:hypothetical protein
VVVEHGLHALLPLAALVDQRVTQPDPGAQLEQVLGRDPGLREPPDHQQLAQMPRVRAVGLGALLSPATGRGLRRLGQMYLSADGLKLLRDEPPPGRRLKRHVELPAAEPGRERAYPVAIRGRDPLA